MSTKGLSRRILDDLTQDFGVSTQQISKDIPQPASPVSAAEGEIDLSSMVDLKWCAFCGKDVVTSIQYVNSKKTFWASLGILFMGGALGCFLLPYFHNSCKDPQTICCNCNRVVN